MSDFVVDGLSAPLSESAITTVALSDTFGVSPPSPLKDAIGPSVVTVNPTPAAPAAVSATNVIEPFSKLLFGLFAGLLNGLDTRVTITPTTPGSLIIVEGGGVAPVTVPVDVP